MRATTAATTTSSGNSCPRLLSSPICLRYVRTQLPLLLCADSDLGPSFSRPMMTRLLADLASLTRQCRRLSGFSDLPYRHSLLFSCLRPHPDPDPSCGSDALTASQTDYSDTARILTAVFQAHGCYHHITRARSKGRIFLDIGLGMLFRSSRSPEARLIGLPTLFQ
jgi:hypothetical protein